MPDKHTGILTANILTLKATEKVPVNFDIRGKGKFYDLSHQ